MNIFTQYEEKPLTLKRKLGIIAMIFTLVPAMAWCYGKHELITSHQEQVRRINSQPIEVALPAELPNNVYDF